LGWEEEGRGKVHPVPFNRRIDPRKKRTQSFRFVPFRLKAVLKDGGTREERVGRGGGGKKKKKRVVSKEQ